MALQIEMGKSQGTGTVRRNLSPKSRLNRDDLRAKGAAKKRGDPGPRRMLVGGRTIYTYWAEEEEKREAATLAAVAAEEERKLEECFNMYINADECSD